MRTIAKDRGPWPHIKNNENNKGQRPINVNGVCEMNSVQNKAPMNYVSWVTVLWLPHLPPPPLSEKVCSSSSVSVSHA